MAAALGYALGCLPSARIVSSLAGAGADLTTVGSGNPGALNASRQLGRRWGVLVGVMDLAKGSLAALCGRRIAGDAGCYLAATTSLAGHMYPPGRRGGKGVATSFGACLVAFPIYAPFDAAIAAVVGIASRNAGEGRRADAPVVVSTGTLLLAAAVWSWRGWPNPGGPKSGPGLFLYALASAALMMSKWIRR